MASLVEKVEHAEEVERQVIETVKELSVQEQLKLLAWLREQR